MIQIPISYGEFFDKISILEIKQEKITDPEKLKLLKKESDALKNSIDPFIKTLVLTHYTALKTINEKLWDVEDELRIMERDKNFGEEFIELARKVYYWNDKRFDLKNSINIFLNSEFREVKQYVKYDTGSKEE